VGIVVDNSFFGQPVLFSNEQFFTTTFDLLALGVEPSTFVGAPVGIDLTLFADEGGFTALWYAGTGVPFLDLPEYGSFSLTYETADPAVVPLPPAFALLLGSLAGFGALRRGCRKQSGAG
jgi:hypothetical protein